MDDDDDDEPVMVSHKRPEPEEFEIDHVKSNAIVCAGLINAVVLCMHGLPQRLTFAGTIGQDPPEDPNFSRENWPSASRFWTEKAYRPVMLHLSNPVNPQSSRTLPGGWSYTAMPPSRPDINVSVLLPPLAAFPELPRDQAIERGPMMAPSFGSLAEKYVTSMEPLLRDNKIRCEARCRMVPTGRAQNFLHYLEVLVFARRPDLHVISERLASHGIQLEHPSSYFPEDYPTQPQYTNPHNPPPGGMRNDFMSRYDGIHRGAGIGTSVQNRELTEKEKKAQVDAIYTSIRSGEELAAVEPVQLISTRLLQHQKQALGFLLNRERDRRWPELLVEKEEESEKANDPEVLEDQKPDTKPGTVKAERALVNGKGAGQSRDVAKGKAKAQAEKEVDEDSISLWKVRKGLNGKIRFWTNLITNRDVDQPPRICRGSILADDMGLGKTITTLALIAHTLQEAKAFGASRVERDAAAEKQIAMQPHSASDASSSTANGKGKVKAERNGKGKVRKARSAEAVILPSIRWTTSSWMTMKARMKAPTTITMTTKMTVTLRHPSPLPSTTLLRPRKHSGPSQEGQGKERQSRSRGRSPQAPRTPDPRYPDCLSSIRRLELGRAVQGALVETEEAVDLYLPWTVSSYQRQVDRES